MTGVRIKPKPTKESNYYALLGMPPGSTLDELHTKYIQLALCYHPDTGDLSDTFKEITIAYSVLKDPERRRNYDMKLYLAGGQCPRCEGKGLRRRLGRSRQVETVICPVCKGTGQRD